MSSSWPELVRIARAVVRDTVAQLPPHLRQHAEALPVAYERRPSAALVEDGLDEDLLGLFVGAPFEDEDSGHGELPPRILLFLENLCDFADDEPDIYRDEVRTTYLHELGHYLGLDELDLEERGLE